MMAYVFNPSTWEVEAGVSLWVQGNSGLHISQSHIVRPCLKNTSFFFLEQLCLVKINQDGAHI